MKNASPLLIAVAAAAFSLTTLAQDHPSQPTGEHHHPPAPAPTNLKVLPKNLTGEQVHEIMHKWAGELGTECTTCHAVDPNRKMPNGHPALNFADDSKPEKNTARLMLRMVQDIDKNYLRKIKDEDHHDEGEEHEHEDGLSCGTCHRGHTHPPKFIPPKEDHDHDHPPAGAKP
ncbi:MAG: c-type cytochrome [Acidobacteria bacterium]|nr:c-type cytochrome [Acidobacteriota bacterium]